MTQTSPPNLPMHLFRPSQVCLRETDAPESSSKIAQQIAAELGISLVTARVLVGRGIETPQAAQAFLSPTLKDHLPNPADMKNLQKAAEFIVGAVEDSRNITIYSDFDVDGVSAGAQLDLYLSKLGAQINRYVPNRFTEGYGLVKSAVETLVQAGTEVLITVDCGITNVKEIAYAKRQGLDVIVLDHHLPQELPPADVVVDPAQEGCSFAEHELCAAGVVWMLLIMMRKVITSRWQAEIEQGRVVVEDPKDYLDLAALGTLCDMVPLKGLNRVIAKRGLEALQKTSKPGLLALKQVSGIGQKMNSGNVGFGLGPRINAAGRLDDGKAAFELLTTEDNKRATTLAESLDRLNKKRKDIEEDVRLACLEQLESSQELLAQPALALFGEKFHPGVIGIVAQRLVEHFYKPTAVMAPGEMLLDGQMQAVVKGSVRSVRGFHVADGLQALDALLIKHGGHAGAGGFTVSCECLEEFQQGFVRVVAEQLPEEKRTRSRLADIAVDIGELDYKVVSQLSELAPFGVGNPAPLFVSENVEIVSVQSLANGHLRLRFSNGKHYVGGVAWRFQGHPLLTKGRKLNIAYQPELNTYKGVSSVQLNIKEVWE